MTGSWLTLCKAAARIAEATGKKVTDQDVLALGEDPGNCLLVDFFQQDHYVVLESSLTAYLAPLPASELAAHGGDDLAESRKPAWRPWSSADHPEDRDQQADYDDTPNEEGDDDQ